MKQKLQYDRKHGAGDLYTVGSQVLKKDFRVNRMYLKRFYPPADKEPVDEKSTQPVDEEPTPPADEEPTPQVVREEDTPLSNVEV